VLDHLKILEEQESMAQNGGISRMDQDEEWSVDEDEEDDDQNEGEEDGSDTDEMK